MMKASPRRFFEQNTKSFQALIAAAAIALPGGAFAGVVINENATWPADPSFATFANNAGTIESERDVRFNRNLAQTFQLSAPLKLDKLYIDYEEGLPGKQVTIRIFTVDNANAGTLVQPESAGFAGTVLVNHDITTTDAINTLDGNNDPLGVLEIDLTDADEITLPATTGTAGYCFQIVRSGTGSDLDVTEERAFKWHWNDEDNVYANGRGYAVNGGTIGALDDFIFAIVAPDQIPPTIAEVRANAAGDRLTVVFSEGVEVTSAGALANYSVNSGLTLSNPEILSPTMVRFTTTPQTAGAEYVITINNVKDDSPQGNVIAANSQSTFKALTLATGYLTAEFYHNIQPRSTDVQTLLDWPAYGQNAPDAVMFLPTFSTPANYGEDYGAKVYGVLVPKESGNYTFFIRSDDNSALYINPAGPALPVPGVDAPIALELDCCDAFQEPDTFDLATSAPVALVAGQRYGVLYVLREAGGGDFGMVAWRKEGDTTFASQLAPMSGTFFETFVETVVPDTTAPTILGAKASGDGLAVNITFSEDIDPSTVTAPANYSVNPALTITEAKVINGSTLQLVTSQQTLGTEYTLTINNVKDFWGNTVAANSEVKFRSLGPYLQGDNGYVVWEAENYDRLVGSRWFFDGVSGDYSGAGSMANADGAGTSEYGDHLEYDISFTKTGRHLIWIHAGADQANAGGADSMWLHVYPKDSAPTRPSGVIDRNPDTYAAITGFSGGNPAGTFVWARNANTGPSPMDFDIPTPGVYTIGIGIREDGSFLDKLIITQNPNYTPAGVGPATTPRQGEAPLPASDLTITTQPNNQTVFQNLPVTFTTAATSSDPLIAYQWQRKVNGVFQDIPNVTGPSFTLFQATVDWDGAVVRAKVSVTGNTQLSNEATLTVLVDNTLPTVVAARGRSDLTALTVVFSENMDQATLGNLANYSIAGLNLQDATILAGGRAVRFTTDTQTIGTEYTLTINGAKDLAQNSVTANTQVKFFGVGPLQQRADGYVVWEAEDYDRLIGGRWREEAPTFASSGGIAIQMPDNIAGETEYGDHLEFDINFTQPGIYTIYHRARANDGNADSAWLHVYPKDGTPTRPSGAVDRNLSNDASMTIPQGPAVDFGWRSDAQTGTDPMTFEIPTAGLYTIGIGPREDGAFLDKYMIRAEGSTFVPTGFGPPETPRQGEPNPPSDLTITKQPASISVLENRAAQFSIGYTSSDAFIGLQWQENGNDIAGANGATLTIDPTTIAMNSNKYRVKFTVNGQDVFSNEATLTVLGDPLPPVLQSAGAFANGTVVGVAFDEPLDPASLGTYLVNGVAPTSATLYLERYVRLDVATPLTAPFTVSTTGVKDTQGNTAGTLQVSGTISDLSSQVLGDETDPLEGGDTFTWGAGYYVAGGGSDIWANADHGFFVYKQFTGAFDVRARVDDLVGGDEWGKAMLMARESLSADSRNQGVLVTKTGPFIAPTTGGMNVYNMQWRDATAGVSGSSATERRISPTVFPSWIRLVRESATSNEMKSYVSYNGTDWILLDTHTTPAPTLPAALYIGMAVTAHDNAAGFPRAEVAYENFSIAPFGNIPFEPNLRISQGATGIRIEWAQGTLVSSPTVDGAYTPVSNASSPYDVTPTDTMRFFQVRNP